MRSAQTLDVTSVSLLLLLAALWGGTFFFAEIALTELPPLTITLLRVALAVPVLWLVLRAKALTLPTDPRLWGGYLVMGALNNAIPFSLIFWGQTQIEGGLASILNGTTAMFGAVAAGLLLKDEPLTLNKVLGALLGVLGVAIIMGPEALLALDPGSLAQLAILLATLSYALAGVWGKTALAGQPPLVNAFGMLLGSTAVMLPLVLWHDGWPEGRYSLPVWASLVSMSVLSTALAYILYFAILIRAGAANLMLVTLLIPPFAIALGVMFLGESLASQAWAGFAVIAFGFAVTDGRVFRMLKRKRAA
jgi:drug/metabolite transporter (DMT)-like permease